MFKRKLSLNIANVIMLSSLVLCASCATFDVPNHSDAKAKQIFKLANKAAPETLKQVKNYYVNPSPANSCRPNQDEPWDQKLVQKLLNHDSYKLALDNYNQRILDVSYYSKEKNDLFGIHIIIEDGNCKEFTLSQGFICEN